MDTRVKLNIMKAIYRKHIVSINPNEEKCKAVPVKSGKTQTCILSPYLSNIVLKVLPKVIRQFRRVRRYKLKRMMLKHLY